MSFELQPTLEDDRIKLRPLCEDDFESLFAVASDPLLWEQHPANDRYQRDVFEEFFRDALDSGGALVIIDRITVTTIGSSRYNGLDESKSEIEIGWTFIARSHWGGSTNRAVKKLMLDHAFRYVDTVVFWIGEANFRSRRAVEKLGAVLRDDVEERGDSPHVVYALSRDQWQDTSAR